MYFYGSNIGPPWRGHLKPSGLDRPNLVRDFLAMLRTTIQVPELSGSEEDDFLIFYVFLWVEPRIYLRSWDLRLNKFGKRLPHNVSY